MKQKIPMPINKSATAEKLVPFHHCRSTYENRLKEFKNWPIFIRTYNSLAVELTSIKS